MEKRNDDQLMENLMDAGCKEEDIRKFMELYRQGKITEEMCFLRKHREVLLQEIHNQNKKLDCLDYLIYNIKQKVH